MSEREAEIDRYRAVYADDPEYRMKGVREGLVKDLIERYVIAAKYTSMLDVGCGRGEVVDWMRAKGVNCWGIDPAAPRHDYVVAQPATDIPFADDKFEVVTMFDVIEHLPVGDDMEACAELARVAQRRIILNASNRSAMHPVHGELHINRRPYDEWDRLFREWYKGSAVSLVSRHWKGFSWVIDL